ncbi:TPA: hypothetical protein HA244_06175 [Candidatus Micrarchaeota archaeon]|nr:hypothetical protein [Candidatus Micrarchaeota archaeon]
MDFVCEAVFISNFKLHSRESISVRGKTFTVFFEESAGLYRAQAKVKWKNPSMADVPFLVTGFKDIEGLRKQVVMELERLLRGGEIQAPGY